MPATALSPRLSTVPLTSTSMQTGAEKVINALVLDDNSFDRRRLIRACEKGAVDAVFQECTSLSDLKAHLDRETYDLVIVDYLLTDGTGLEALARIFAHKDHHCVATIMVAGVKDAAVARNAVAMGCATYIEKVSISPVFMREQIGNALYQAKTARRHIRDNRIRRARKALESARAPRG